MMQRMPPPFLPGNSVINMCAVETPRPPVGLLQFARGEYAKFLIGYPA